MPNTERLEGFGVAIDQSDRSGNGHSTHFLTFLIESETGIRTLALLELIDVGVLEIRRSLFESPQSPSEACADQARLLVHQVSDWGSGVAIKMGRRQGATKEHI